MSSIDTLCSIFKEHNNIFIRSCLDSNLAIGASAHKTEEPKVHTFLTEAIIGIIKNIEGSLSIDKIHFCLTKALEDSVNYILI